MLRLLTVDSSVRYIPLDCLRADPDEVSDIALDLSPILEDWIAADGLIHPFEVVAHEDHFEVVDGRKRMIALTWMVQDNIIVMDRLTGTSRPASEVYSLVPCLVV